MPDVPDETEDVQPVDSRRGPEALDTESAGDVGSTPSPVITPRKPGGLPTHLSLTKQVQMLAVWPLLEQVVAWLVWFVDTALAGRLPGEGVAVMTTEAVGAASYLVWLMGLLQGAVGIGATAMVARAVGARHRREANASVGQAVLLAFVWGIVLGVVFYLSGPYWWKLFGLEGESVEAATTYLQMLSLVAPFMSVLFVSGSCMRGAGNTRTPFYTMLVVNIVNAIVSLTLVRGFDMGITGIAIGTMSAWTIGALINVALLLYGTHGIRLHLHRLRLQRGIMKRLLRIGVPSLVDSGLMWTGNLLVVWVVGKLAIMNINEAPIGSHIIAIRIEGLSFLPGYAFAVAASSIVGQYLGAGDTETARKAAWACWRYGTAVMVPLGVLFMVVPGWFVWLMTDKQPFVQDVPPLLIMAGWAQIGFATQMILAGALRGAGDTRVVMIINTVFTFALRVPLCMFAVFVMGWGLTAIWMLLSVELMLRSLAVVWRFMQGGWAKIDV